VANGNSQAAGSRVRSPAVIGSILNPASDQCPLSKWPVIDSGSRQVAHVLLQDGHVPGRKAAAIPFGAVTPVSQDAIQLNIAKRQVKDLPPGWHRPPG
jgi:hypothetical protein